MGALSHEDAEHDSALSHEHAEHFEAERGRMDAADAESLEAERERRDAAYPSQPEDNECQGAAAGSANGCAAPPASRIPRGLSGPEIRFATPLRVVMNSSPHMAAPRRLSQDG